MSLAQAEESVIERVAGGVARECAARGRAFSGDLVAFMVRAVLLDSRNGFNVDRTLTKQDVQKLEELCLDKLTASCSPSLDTVKMQVYFGTSYISRREFLEEIHQMLESRLSQLSREITDVRPKTKADLDALYRKIISYTLHFSGIGSPSDINAVHEATAALQSIFPPSGLGAFAVLSKRDKEQQLGELATVATGIRLFNNASKQGAEMVNLFKLLPAELHEALRVDSERIEHALNASQTLAWRYTALLEKLSDAGRRSGECDVSPVLLKQALCNVRQHEAFLKMLLADAGFSSKRAGILQTEFSAQMRLLKEAVRSKTAVPAAKVFPLFKALSRLWSGLQDEAELLNIFNNIVLNLHPFLASQAKLFSEAHLDGLLEGAEVKTDEQRMSESSVERVNPAETSSQEWLLPETTAGFSQLPLQYGGFCGYTLVSKDGLLLPGNPSIGILKHKGKFYAFNSKQAALKFAESPDDFIAEVAEKAKGSPELIRLLKLHQQFPYISPTSEMQPREDSAAEPAAVCEGSTQTDMHLLRTNIVKSYEWNEWELRRKAIKLADLRTTVTHSTQTDLSHMRRENATQTWLPKNVGCQTKRDGECNVPRPHVYLAGLRGQRGSSMVKTNLTRPVDE